MRKKCKLKSKFQEKKMQKGRQEYNERIMNAFMKCSRKILFSSLMLNIKGSLRNVVLQTVPYLGAAFLFWFFLSPLKKKKFPRLRSLMTHQIQRMNQNHSSFHSSNYVFKAAWSIRDLKHWWLHMNEWTL